MQHLEQCALDVPGHALAVALQERIQTNVRPAVTGDLHRAVFLDMVRQDMRLTAMLFRFEKRAVIPPSRERCILQRAEQFIRQMASLVAIVCLLKCFRQPRQLFQFAFEFIHHS